MEEEARDVDRSANGAPPATRPTVKDPAGILAANGGWAAASS